MIISLLWKDCEGGENIIAFLSILMLVAARFSLVFFSATFGWFLTGVFMLILTELVYHIEPRSEKEKKKGRAYWYVFFKKLDSVVDAALFLGLSIGVYHIFKNVTLQGTLHVVKIAGIVVGCILLLVVYIWVNRLRDKPKKKRGKKKQ